jgi:hypothetical protein
MDNVYRWGKANWGNIPRGIKAIQTRLQNLNSISPTREQITTKHQLETNLDTLLLKEELWWSQRAKSNWLQHGDKNSKYFHFKASQRHRKIFRKFFSLTSMTSSLPLILPTFKMLLMWLPTEYPLR